MAPVTIRLPPVLNSLFPGSPARVELEAATVGEAIDGLDRRWPGMRDRLCEPKPRLRPHINVFVAGQRTSLETRLDPGAEIWILLAIRGG